MREKYFESTVILKPEGGMEAVRQFGERINGIVESLNGKIVSFQSWGEKKLAYEIKKNMKGHYVYFDYVGSGALVAELERNFNNWEYVLKFMSVRIEKEASLDELRANAKGVAVMADRIQEWRPRDDRPERSTPTPVAAEPTPAPGDDNREYNAKLQQSLNKSKEVDEENVEL
jgi:small subunit ribosomal protein S6